MSHGSWGKALGLACFLGGSLFGPLSAIATEPGAEEPPPIPAVVASNSKWFLRLQPDASIDYRGVVSFDEAGTGTGAFLYPAPSFVGLLAAIATHGVIVDSVKRNQKSSLQTAADQVLLPYRGVLDQFNFRDLMQRALHKTATGTDGSLLEASAEAGRETVVESMPVFSLTQDQKTIVLNNLVAIQRPGVSPEAAYRNSIRIVSAPRESADPAAFWTANDGERLKDESARLVAESLDIAFRDLAGTMLQEGAPHRTVRYREGTAEKMERALVLNEQCGRLLIRTLRGNLMSVPASQSTPVASAQDRCEPEFTSRN
jgi:hypothetical protein